MIYNFLYKYEERNIYANDEGRSCIGIDNEFQSWLRLNKDNLPSDIQEKVDAGELTIEPADD